MINLYMINVRRDAKVYSSPFLEVSVTPTEGKAMYFMYSVWEEHVSVQGDNQATSQFIENPSNLHNLQHLTALWLAAFLDSCHDRYIAGRDRNFLNITCISSKKRRTNKCFWYLHCFYM